MNVLTEEQTYPRDSAVTLDAEPKTVLIVDESEETRDVLATALERKGVKTFTASVLRRGVAIAKKQKPNLIVFDVDSVTTSPEAALNEFTREGEIHDAPIVAIGSMKFEAPITEGEFISKPYHFAPLLQKIERFLQGAGEVQTNNEESIEILS